MTVLLAAAPAATFTDTDPWGTLTYPGIFTVAGAEVVRDRFTVAAPSGEMFRLGT
jgi:hypothetical protein